MDTRTVGTLAHVLEGVGLATIAISAIRGIAERLQPPRTLHCEFPLGWPLGRPHDAKLQREVLEAALALLRAPAGPVLADFPVVVADSSDEPLSCSLAVSETPGRQLVIQEALAYRPAYDRQLARSGRSLVGRAVTPAQVPLALEAFLQIAKGVPWRESALPGDPASVAMDVRAYYEEAGLALTDGPAGARAAESWFYRSTRAGATVRQARDALIEAGEPQDVWYGMVPRTLHVLPEGTSGAAHQRARC